MAETLPLFPEGLSNPFRDRLKASLAKSAAKQIYLGTSSWKYEGWLGQIYSQERYMVRGRFSKARFAEHCLAEYAETFSTVCGDFAFYQFPAESFWQKLFQTSPEQLRFSFKVPEEITTPRFPSTERYGNLGGARNPYFLNSPVLGDLFLQQLQPYSARISALIFEFGPMCGRLFSPAEFAALIDRFLYAFQKKFDLQLRLGIPSSWQSRIMQKRYVVTL